MRDGEKKLVYLANPYGFSIQQRQLILPELIRTLESVDPRIEVWEPFDRTGHLVGKDIGWEWRIGQTDKAYVETCDAFFAVVNGNPPDEGVMVELGMAIALKKEIFLFRDDFRKCSDSEAYPLNLMLFTGFNHLSWYTRFYRSINQVLDRTMDYYKWAIQ